LPLDSKHEAVRVNRYRCHVISIPLFRHALDPARPVLGRLGALSAGLDERILKNETPHIVSQCYTKTTDDQGRIHNPCYACHTESQAPNYLNDQDLQLTFSFPAPAEENPWKNLYKDRRAAIAAISDDAMRDYIRQSNYLDAEGRIIPAQRLAESPQTGITTTTAAGKAICRMPISASTTRASISTRRDI
jgi:hypothetical protein